MAFAHFDTQQCTCYAYNSRLDGLDPKVGPLSVRMSQRHPSVCWNNWPLSPWNMSGQTWWTAFIGCQQIILWLNDFLSVRFYLYTYTTIKNDFNRQFPYTNGYWTLNRYHHGWSRRVRHFLALQVAACPWLISWEQAVSNKGLAVRCLVMMMGMAVVCGYYHRKLRPALVAGYTSGGITYSPQWFGYPKVTMFDKQSLWFPILGCMMVPRAVLSIEIHNVR